MNLPLRHPRLEVVHERVFVLERGKKRCLFFALQFELGQGHSLELQFVCG
jgi:hypothetical protein